ncbi:hypothetical protein Tco_0388978 [Tanacetum coccineum]
MSSQVPTQYIDDTESLLSPIHGSSPLFDTEDPYAQAMRAYETDSTSPFLYHHSPPHQRVRRISDILPEEDPEEDPDEEPASAENPTTNIPLGLGQRAVVLQQREFAGDGIPKCNIRPTVSTGSPAPSTLPNSPAAPTAPAPDIPTEAKYEDDDDNDTIEQIRALLEMHASVIDLHSDKLDDLVPSRFDEYEHDVNRLNTRTGNMVRDLTTITPKRFDDGPRCTHFTLQK